MRLAEFILVEMGTVRRVGGVREDVAGAEVIFDPLKRGAAAQCRGANTKGLGLGLFIVREITRARGGEGELHSSDGQTVFPVLLPRENDPAPTAA